MKKAKKPGDNISLKLKKNESGAIVDWINSQTNLMDSIRYLIENEIAYNGIRNLQSFVPAERSMPAIAAAAPASADPGYSRVIFPVNEEIAAAAEPVKEEMEIQEVQEEQVIEDDIDDEDIDSWT